MPKLIFNGKKSILLPAFFALMKHLSMFKVFTIVSNVLVITILDTIFLGYIYESISIISLDSLFGDCMN